MTGIIGPLLLILGICSYFALVLAFGGGDPNHSGHNPPQSGL